MTPLLLLAGEGRRRKFGIGAERRSAGDGATASRQWERQRAAADRRGLEK